MMARFRAARRRGWTTQIEGAEEVIQLLNEIGDAASDVLAAAARAGGDIALEGAKRRCPVDEGDLKASLKMEKGKSKKPNIHQLVEIKPGKKEYYGTFVELGTKRQPAQPFMRPAVNENKARIGEAVSQAVLRALGRIN